MIVIAIAFADYRAFGYTFSTVMRMDSLSTSLWRLLLYYIYRISAVFVTPPDVDFCFRIQKMLCFSGLFAFLRNQDENLSVSRHVETRKLLTYFHDFWYFRFLRKFIKLLKILFRPGNIWYKDRSMLRPEWLSLPSTVLGRSDPIRKIRSFSNVRI